MAENFNPYGSAISRSNLFVYDPNPFMSKTLGKGQKELQKGLDELVATRRKEVQYASDILNNLGALKDQAELEHNNFINARVDTLIEQVKGNMTKKGKLGLVSFNFNNPEFQLQLKQGVNQIKRGINNSKLLKDQYDDFVKFLNINKDVVSNQVDLLNRASQNVTNPNNIFTANDVTTSFTNLKDEAIDERKFIYQTAQGILQTSGGPTINYVATDAEGKPVTVTGQFNENLYILDDTGFNILKDANGKPLINDTYVETVKESILKSTNIKSVTEWLNNPDNNEEFVRMLTSDLDVKIQTELDRLKIKTQKAILKNAEEKGDKDKITDGYSTVNNITYDNIPYEGVALTDKVKVENIPVDKVGDIQVGLPIPEVVDIGFTTDGKKAITARFGETLVLISEGIKVSDVYDEQTLQGIDAGPEVLNAVFDKNTVDNIWARVDTQAINKLSGTDQQAYEFVRNRLQNNTQNKPTDSSTIEQINNDNNNNILSSEITEENLESKEKILNDIQNRPNNFEGLKIDDIQLTYEQTINLEEELSKNIEDFKKTIKDQLDKNTSQKNTVNKAIEDTKQDVESIISLKKDIDERKTGMFGIGSPYSQSDAKRLLRQKLESFFKKFDERLEAMKESGATEEQIKILEDLKAQVN